MAFDDEAVRTQDSWRTGECRVFATFRVDASFRIFEVANGDAEAVVATHSQHKRATEIKAHLNRRGSAFFSELDEDAAAPFFSSAEAAVLSAAFFSSADLPLSAKRVNHALLCSLSCNIAHLALERVEQTYLQHSQLVLRLARRWLFSFQPAAQQTQSDQELHKS